MCSAPQQRAPFRHLDVQKWSEHGVLWTFWLENVLRSTTVCTFSASQLPRVVRHWCALYILTWKCASRHKGVHFFDISNLKSGPTLVCFVHFDLEMCFALQRRALLRHRNFQKWSDVSAFCILIWTCASRHNGVQFCMSHLTTWLRTRRFSEPTFRPSGATNHWKQHSESRLSYLFVHLHLLSLLSFSSLIFSLLLFSSLTLPTSAFPSVNLSEVWLLNFLPFYNQSCVKYKIYHNQYWCKNRAVTLRPIDQRQYVSGEHDVCVADPNFRDPGPIFAKSKAGDSLDRPWGGLKHLQT